MLEKLAPSLAALSLVAAAGGGLQALIPAPLERTWTARLGLAYLLGLAWVGLGLWLVGYLFGSPLGRPLALLLIAAPVVGGCAAAALRRSWGGLGAAGELDRSSSRWPGLVVVAVVGVQSVALLAHTGAEPVTDFDGRMTWGPQARYLQASGSVLPEALTDARTFVIHPRYPILLPLLQVATAELSGGSLDGFAVRPLYALFLPAFAAALWPALRRAGGGAGAAISTLLLFAAPIVLREREAGPLGTYSDFPLAAFLGVGLAQLLHPRAASEPWRGWIAGLLLAAAAGAKNEGLVLAAAAAGVAAWVSRRGPRRRALRAAGAAALAVALALVMIVAWRSEIPNRNDEKYFEKLVLSGPVPDLAGRLATVASVIAERTFERASWGWLSWLAPPLLLLGARGLRRRSCRAAALLIAAELTLALAAYAVVEDPAIVGVTWNRFMIQMYAPLALLLAASAGAVLARLPRRYWTEIATT